MSSTDSESEIIAKKIQAEEKLAALQEDARKKQQSAAKLQLKIEIQRNRLTAETAKLEAEIAVTKAVNTNVLILIEGFTTSASIMLRYYAIRLPRRRVLGSKPRLI